ncbi:MAG: cytochrome c oxidase assembly protein [Gammaproteobacteria bacterium]|nr:cytochrome c oxidase assembly protein [Gammaproteobacteria bacterium]MYD76516.1 cytochrome c oxidase assembly protein [Gammaproteobacteria bacterium]MYJ51805.1 cytochrome c oxidase assembly protein [Gammaproteobacteria bacterium]
MKPRLKILHLVLIPIAMFGFGYLMVPIYDIFCDITGLNGKTGSISQAEAELLETDTERRVRVEFISALNRNAPWDFHPDVKSMRVTPGKPYTTSYTATNRLDRLMTGQAVPSVAPAKAASYFNKTECFCFVQQTFEPRESRQMPLVFVVDPDLPDDINTLTLSYTFFDVNSRIN